jgi:hypothetical protein
LKKLNSVKIFHHHLTAVHIPLRTRTETDVTKMQNTNNKFNKRSDSIDMISDEYDSDSKENEHVS